MALLLKEYLSKVKFISGVKINPETRVCIWHSMYLLV